MKPGVADSTPSAAPGILLRPVPPNDLSARFFVELALGLWIALACIDRRAIGPGFTRLMALFALGAIVPALLLSRGGGADGAALAQVGRLGFGGLVLAALLLAGRVPLGVERLVVVSGAAVGLLGLLVSVKDGLPSNTAVPMALSLAGTLGSTLVLGLVTGAMILGHWYLVTPDLPVAHLGRLTRLALLATYAKAALLAFAIGLDADRFGPAARSFGGAFGLGSAAGGNFQSELDFLWLAARVLIGLVGPAVLCHMTLATVKLKATQPATGILYAASVTVLMGELFALVGERSFGVVL